MRAGEGGPWEGGPGWSGLACGGRVGGAEGGAL